ncbi:uncharacterized protein LOC128857728 [Anastrepha ludens]|uniref:uncharacterized protein LOC128857728 n=1 Tax=Anastrepha ludens TaxID=28586 RepID=UPI0023AF8319|nr:uncharacterized protein LOC128857728 [Anastrepha ludens]XP_053949451.1 uncharacterized protein LOC128857728 [Anastrepha ludens]
MLGQEQLLEQSSIATSVGLSPQEEALQSLCKQLLKSTFFRGYYEERRFVDAVSDYRDIVGLHCSERDVERLLLDIKCKLQLFYQNSPKVWIGITHGACMGIIPKKYTLNTNIWLQLQEVAFGQYWFSVKSVRFRKNEVLLKLKVVRAVEPETRFERISSSHFHTPTLSHASNTSALAVKDSAKTLQSTPQHEELASRSNVENPEVMQIDYEDFVNVLRGWGATIKHTVYDFISNDINKDNIKDFLQFLGLVVVSLLTGSVVAIKYLGNFALRFMFEFTRFTQVMTPIILKLIDVINKIVGGFYILVAMIWKDAFMKKKMPKEGVLHDYKEYPPSNLKAIEYNRPLYKSIEYNIRHSPLHSPQPPFMGTSRGPFTEFERKFQ